MAPNGAYRAIWSHAMSTTTSGSAYVKRTRPSTKQATSQADALLAQFMAVEDDASLAQRMREVVASNRRKAGKPRKAAA